MESLLLGSPVIIHQLHDGAYNLLFLLNFVYLIKHALIRLPLGRVWLSSPYPENEIRIPITIHGVPGLPVQNFSDPEL